MSLILPDFYRERAARLAAHRPGVAWCPTCRRPFRQPHAGAAFCSSECSRDREERRPEEPKRRVKHVPAFAPRRRRMGRPPGMTRDDLQCSACGRRGHIASNRNCPQRSGS